MRLLLLPFSLIYAFLIFLRNRLYDWNVFSSKSFSIPTIVVGNLSLGGTGKTPHIEWLIRNLSTSHKMQVLSRGYGRKTKGYLEVLESSHVMDVGDEPLQIKLAFPETRVVVDENRSRAIQIAQDEANPVDAILLDDAFQHRKVKASFNLLLTTYNRPFYRDWMLPAGNLRDNRFEKRRADAIIITKCPESLSNAEKDAFRSKLRTHRDRIWFSKIVYGEPIPVFEGAPALPKRVVGLSGIAQPDAFKAALKERFEVTSFVAFRDHHEFERKEIEGLAGRIGTFETGIVTTAKDAVRLKPFFQELGQYPVYYLPITIEVEKGDELVQMINKKL